MKKITCELCGSNDLIKQDGFYVCQHCGTKYTTEDAKKLMVEVVSPVEIDKSKEIENLYVLARRAAADNNYENAGNYYNQIISSDPDSWEAYFYSVYFRTINCKIAEISSAADNLDGCLKSTFELIEKNVLDENERTEVFRKITDSIITACKMLYNSSISNFSSMSQNIKLNHRDELVIRCDASARPLSTWGYLLRKYDSSPAVKNCIIDCYKTKVDLVRKFFSSGIHLTLTIGVLKSIENSIDSEVAYIKQYEPAYNTPVKKYENTGKSAGIYFFMFVLAVIIWVFIGMQSC